MIDSEWTNRFLSAAEFFALAKARLSLNTQPAISLGLPNGVTRSMARQRIVHVLIQGPTSVRILLFTFSSSAQLAHQALRCFFRSSYGAIRMGVP